MKSIDPKYPNEKIVRDMLKAKKYRGNMKDYAILAGDMMMDYKATYKVTRSEFKTPDQEKKGEILLVHKKWLHRFISEQEAILFWNPKLRMRVSKHVENVSGSKREKVAS